MRYNKRMQCKSLSDTAILGYLAAFQGSWTLDFSGKGTNFKTGWPQDLSFAFPASSPRKLRIAKMVMLERRGLITGCTCGCRGDFEITDKGLAKIGLPRTTGVIG